MRVIKLKLIKIIKHLQMSEDSKIGTFGFMRTPLNLSGRIITVVSLVKTTQSKTKSVITASFSLVNLIVYFLKSEKHFSSTF